MSNDFLYSNESGNSKYYERTLTDIWNLAINSNIVYGDPEQIVLWTVASSAPYNEIDYFINQSTGDINILRSGIFSVGIRYVIGTAPSPEHLLFFITKMDVTRLGSLSIDPYLNQKCGYIYTEDNSVLYITFSYSGYFREGDVFNFTIQNYDSDVTHATPVLLTNTELSIIKIN